MPQTRQARIELLIIAGLSLMALFSFGRTLSKFTNPAFGGLDLHSFWHSGHALRQREDPLRFALDHRAPDLPVHYIDGAITTEPPVAQPGLSTIPSNTSPIYLPPLSDRLRSYPFSHVSPQSEVCCLA